MIGQGDVRRSDGKGVALLNNTNSTIEAGAIVYVTGYSTRMRCVTVAKAQANAAGHVPAYVVDKDIAADKRGIGYSFVELDGIDTSQQRVGAGAFLSTSTAGATVYVEPVTSGTDDFRVGHVTRSAVNGSVQYDLRGRLGHAATSLPSAVLIDKPHYDAGGVYIGWVRFTGNMSDGDRISISAAGGTPRVYEFDTAANSSLNVGADVRININAAQTNTASAAAFAAAVNGDSSRVVNAYASGAMVALVAKDQDTQTAFVLGKPVDANSRIVLSGAAATGGATRAPRRLLIGQYTLTAADITALAASVPVLIGALSSTAVPQLQQLTIWRGSNASWARVADGSTWNILQVNSNYYGLFCTDAQNPAVLAAGDIIAFELVATR